MSSHNNKTKFVAEVSSNHHQNIERCLQFIDVSSEIGCDAVKFQLFKIDQLFAPEVLRQQESLRARKKWELPALFLPELARRCVEKKIEFSCTPFYLEAVEELEPYVDFYKIASYELLWDSLLEECAGTGKPLVLSTGMANLEEVDHAVEVITRNGNCELTLLHCVSGYPAPPSEANLAVIELLRDRYGCSVGWSDHTVNSGVVDRAVHKWGAAMVEFHLDLDGEGEEFDAGHCWLPDPMGQVIKKNHQGWLADGIAHKEPVPIELPDRDWRADPEDGLRPLKKTRDEFQLKE